MSLNTSKPSEDDSFMSWMDAQNSKRKYPLEWVLQNLKDNHDNRSSSSQIERARLKEIENKLESKSRDINRLSQRLNKDSQKFYKNTDKVVGRLQEAEQKIDNMEQNVKNDKLQAIQILALFVAFFTFVSVQFQLFTSLKSVLAVISLSLILLGALLLFVSTTFLGMVYYHAKDSGSEGQKFGKPFLILLSVFSILLLVLGIFLACVANKQDSTTSQSLVRSCSDLEKKVIAEFNNGHTDQANFIRETYDAKCIK